MTQDKKKLIVLLVLGFLLLGVGAWQFLSLSSPGEEKAEPKSASKNQTSQPTPPQPTNLQQDTPYWLLGTKRQNPFQPKDLPDEEGNTSSPPQGNMVRPPTSSPKPPAPRVKPNIEIPAVPPPWMVTPTPPQGETQPKQPAEEEPFSYVVVGVLDGPKPVAILQSPAGGQQLVRVGDHLGPQTQIIAIEGRTVTVRHKKTILKLTVGGK